MRKKLQSWNNVYKNHSSKKQQKTKQTNQGDENFCKFNKLRTQNNVLKNISQQFQLFDAVGEQKITISIQTEGASLFIENVLIKCDVCCYDTCFSSLFLRNTDEHWTQIFVYILQTFVNFFVQLYYFYELCCCCYWLLIEDETHCNIKNIHFIDWFNTCANTITANKRC